MNQLLNSIYSDSTRFYVSNPYPKKGETITIKLRIKDNDIINRIYLSYKKFGAVVHEEMFITYHKNGLSYYEASATCFEEKLCYEFILATDDKIYHYTQHRVSDYVPDESKDFQILVDYDAPEWMKSTVFYQILPDRFFNSRSDLTVQPDHYTYGGKKPLNMKWDEAPLEYEETHCLDFYGGDLYGIIEKLDYLQDLGVNGIYLNPIFKSPTMHKYDALDYFEVDPSLGGDEALIKLADAMHQRNMRLVLDISINHTSSSSIWFNKTAEFYPLEVGAYNNQEAKQRAYYFFNDDNEYLSWAGVESMPTLNYSSLELRDIIYKGNNSVLKKWLKPPYNIDGWRFDVADVMGRNEELNVYHELWEDIYTEIKKTKRDALIVAEEWSDAWTMYNGKEWDSTMNYFQVARPLREFAGEQDLFLVRNKELRKIKYHTSGEQLRNRIIQFADKVPSQIQYQMFNLINSHDVPRLHNNPEIDYHVYQGAIITLFGLPGAVSIYYGDEKYLDGRISSNEGCRYPMDWSEDLPSNKQETFDLYKTLIKLKTSDEALQDGGFKIVGFTEETFAFSRFTQDKVYLFIWSKSKDKETVVVDLDHYGMVDCTVEVVVGQAAYTHDETQLKIVVDARAALILRLTNG